MKDFLLVLCSLVSWVASEDANLIMDRILEEGNRNIKRETVLQEIETKTWPGLKIRASYVKVSRDVDKVSRIRDAVIGLSEDKKGILTAHLSSGTIIVTLDRMHVITPFMTFESYAEISYTGELFVESPVDMNANCAECEADFHTVDMDTPRLVRFESQGLPGKLFDFLVWKLQGTQIMGNIVSSLFGPPFYKTTLQPFEKAAKRNLCKCPNPEKSIFKRNS